MGSRSGGPCELRSNARWRNLSTSQKLDQQFPAFETEIHRIEVQPGGTYRIPTLRGER